MYSSVHQSAFNLIWIIHVSVGNSNVVLLLRYSMLRSDGDILSKESSGLFPALMRRWRSPATLMLRAANSSSISSSSGDGVGELQLESDSPAFHSVIAIPFITGKYDFRLTGRLGITSSLYTLLLTDFHHSLLSSSDFILNSEFYESKKEARHFHKI